MQMRARGAAVGWYVDLWVTILVAGGCLLMDVDPPPTLFDPCRGRLCLPKYASCGEEGLDYIRAGFGQGEGVWEDCADRPVAI